MRGYMLMSHEQTVADVISLDELQEIAQGLPVEIPHWKQDQTMTVLLGPVDFTPRIAQASAIAGGLPNEARTAVSESFGEATEAAAAGMDEEKLAKMQHLLDEVAKEALKKPTYAEIHDAGLFLTLEQKMAIWAHATGSTTLLSQFRENAGDDDGAPVDSDEE